MLSIIISTALVLTTLALPITAKAATYTEGDFKYLTGELDENTTVAVITGYTGTNTEVGLPSEIGGYPVFAVQMLKSDVIEHLTIPDSVEVIFSPSCLNLKTITIGKGFGYNSLQDIGTDVHEVYGVFCYCPKLETITVSEENPYFSSVDGVLFNKTQTELKYYPRSHGTAYTIPDTVTSIANSAFFNGSPESMIEEIIIPNTVTSIGGSAFGNCTNLETVSIPESVESVGANAFTNCENAVVTYTGNNQTVADALDESGAGSVIATEFEGENIQVSNTDETGEATTETFAFTADEHDGGATGFVTAINNKTKKTQVTINHITWKVTASDGTKRKYTSTSNDFTAFNLLPSDDTTFVIFVVSNLYDAGAKVVAEVD